MRDDLGHDVPLGAPARRVVSLVPSITEALAHTVPDALVGATQWCTHPRWLDVPRVRGTKNPDLAAIRALRPDLVVANQEENRHLDVDRLREAGVAVWVTRIDSVEEALTSLSRLFAEAFALHRVSWLEDAAAVWAPSPRLRGLRVAVPVWREPWMWVGRDTYIDDLLARMGCVNVVAPLASRYPALELAAVFAQHPDLVVLPDEPYPFSHTDGPEAVAPVPARIVPGRAMAWYGPAMVWARPVLEGLLSR